MATFRSLKGRDGRWGGIGEASRLAPTLGGFRRVEGLVPNRDATDLTFAPAGKLCGQPFYGQSWLVASVSVGGGATTITLDVSMEADGNAYLPATFDVFVPADDAAYVGTRTGAATFTIPTAASAVDAGDWISIKRKHRVHALQTVNSVAAVVLETACYQGVSTELRNVATMVCSGPLSTDDPPRPGIPDENDVGFVMWPCPTMAPGVNTSEVGHDSSAQYLRHYTIERRMQVDALNGRLLIAVPGLWAMLEANLRRASQWLPRDTDTATYQPNVRWTKLLGIPRGHMPNAGISTAVSGACPVGWYAAAVGYYDPFTGEVGLMSPIQVANAAAPCRLDVYASRARAVAYEAVGLQTLLYLAGPFTDEASARSAILTPYYTVGPLRSSLDYGAQNTTPVAYCDKFQVSVASLDALQAVSPYRSGIIEVPPPGASWVRVARSRMFCGGERPDHWDITAWPASATVGTETKYFLLRPHEWNVNLPGYGALAWGKLPPAVAGRIVGRLGVTIGTGAILSLHNAIVGTIAADLPSGAVGPETLMIDFNAGTVGAYSAPNLQSFRVLSRQNGVSYSEEDRPGVHAAISELPVDSLSDRLTVAASRIGGDLLIHTPRETVAFGWGSLPTGAGQLQLSNTDGCVAAASVVEVPGGSIAFADRGPVLWPGGEWLGMGIGETWSGLQRDSEGMVVCSGSAYDRERGLVFWAVRRSADGDWAAASSDEEKHKVPADTLLVLHLATRAWSVVDRPGNLAIEALASMLVDGRMAPVIASASEDRVDDTFCPLYALDATTEAGDPTEYVVTTDRDPTNRVAVVGSAIVDCVSGDYAMVRTADGSECKWFGLSGGEHASGLTLGESSAEANGATWNVGDVVVTRCAHGLIETHRLSAYVDGTQTRVVTVAVVANVEAEHAYCRVRATLPDADATVVDLTEPWGMRLNNGVTTASQKCSVVDAKITLELIADGPVEIKDVLIEVE